MFESKSLFAAGLVAALATTAATAAPVYTEVSNVGAGAPAETIYASDVSAVDLLHGNVGVESGVGWQTPGSSSKLTNGVHGPSFDQDQAGSQSEIAWANVGSVVTFTLGTGDNGLGYDITSVQSIAAWNGSGLGNQGYTLEVQAVGGSFTTLATVAYAPLVNVAGATKVTITDDGFGPGGILATGIEAIRFTHNAVPGAANNWVTYRELDVFGASTVPEPGSLALLGLGSLIIARRRARHIPAAEPS